MEKTTRKKKNDDTQYEIHVFDVRYTDSYNPELMKDKYRTWRYIIDGDGKEHIVVFEEKHTVNEDE